MVLRSSLILLLLSALSLAQVSAERIALPMNGALRQLDPVGFPLGLLPLPSSAVVLAVAVDGEGRTYVTTSDNRLHSFGAQGALRWSIGLSESPGPMAITDDGRILLGQSDLGQNSPRIRVFDEAGTLIQSWPTFATPTRLVIEQQGVLACVELDAAGQGRLRTYDASVGTLLAERLGAGLFTALAPRRGGGFFATQIDEPSVSPTRFTNVVALDVMLQAIGGFSTAPELLPSRVLQSPQGQVYVSYPASSSGRPALAVFDAQGQRQDQIDLPAGVAAMHLDGFGRVIATLIDPHAPTGTQTIIEAFDDRLRTRWTRLGAFSTNAGQPRGEGDASGALFAFFTEPGGDLDGDGRINSQEVDLGSSPFDPQSRPIRVSGPTAIAVGAAASFGIEAPESAGQPWFGYWSWNPEGLPFRFFAPGDSRVLEVSPLAVGNPLALDPLYLLRNESSLFTNLDGTFDATGRGTTLLLVPQDPRLIGRSIWLGLLLPDLGAPLGVAGIAPSHRVDFR